MGNRGLSKEHQDASHVVGCLRVAVVAAFAVVAAPARAAIDQPIAVWQMNEAPGSRTMVDSGGHGLNGTIGSHVQVGTALSGGGTGYRFPYLQPNTPPADPSMWCGWPTTRR